MAEDWQNFGQALRQMGMDLSGASAQNSTPSALQELSAYQNMTPDQQKIYWNIKRQQQIVNLGGTQAIMNPAGGGAPMAVMPVTPKPDQMPEFQGEQEKAKATGKEVGTAEGAIEKKYIQAPQIDVLLNQAEKLLPTATSGGANTLIKKGAGFFNVATEGAPTDTKLDVIAGNLTSTVPRFEGPQGVADVKLYQQMAGDFANTNLPQETRLSALQAMRDLNNKYMTKPGNAPAAPSAAPTAPAVNPAAGAPATINFQDWGKK